MKKLLFYAALVVGMAFTVSCSKNEQAPDSNGMADLHQFVLRCRNHPETMIAPLCKADSALYYFDVYSHLYEGHIFRLSKSNREGYVNISMVTDPKVIEGFYARFSAYENGAKEVDIIKTTDSVELNNWYGSHLKNGDVVYLHLEPQTGISYGEACPQGDGKSTGMQKQE